MYHCPSRLPNARGLAYTLLNKDHERRNRGPFDWPSRCDCTGALIALGTPFSQVHFEGACIEDHEPV
jgi:hypothetical protein